MHYGKTLNRIIQAHGTTASGISKELGIAHGTVLAALTKQDQTMRTATLDKVLDRLNESHESYTAKVLINWDGSMEDGLKLQIIQDIMAMETAQLLQTVAVTQNLTIPAEPMATKKVLKVTNPDPEALALNKALQQQIEKT